MVIWLSFGLFFLTVHLLFMAFHVIHAHQCRLNYLAVKGGVHPGYISGDVGLSVTYVGLQSSFFFLALSVFFWLLLVIFAGIGAMVEFQSVRHALWKSFAAADYLIAIWIIMVWKIFSQKILSYVFATDRKFTLRFIPYLFLLDYVFFFFQIVLGFASFVFRLISTILTVSTVLFRADIRVLVSGAEALDYGFESYCSVLTMDQRELNHIVLGFLGYFDAKRMFTHRKGISFTFPGDSRDEERGTAAAATATDDDDDIPLILNPTINNDTNGDDGQVNSRAARRWHLAFTLMNNPSLQLLRKGRTGYSNTEKFIMSRYTC
jgi:hypothetical protein